MIYCIWLDGEMGLPRGGRWLAAHVSFIPAPVTAWWGASRSTGERRLEPRSAAQAGPRANHGLSADRDRGLRWTQHAGWIRCSCNVVRGVGDQGGLASAR